MNSVVSQKSAILSVAQVSSERETTMSAQLVTGALSATAAKEIAAKHKMSLAQAISVMQAAFDARAISTKSHKIIMRNVQDDCTLHDTSVAQECCYTYRMLSTQTEMYMGTSHSEEIIAAARIIHDEAIVMKERANSKLRKSDTEHVATVRTKRATQEVASSKNVSVEYSDTLDVFIETAKVAWRMQYDALARRAEQQRHAQALDAVSALNASAAKLGISVEQMIALAQEVAKAQAIAAAEAATA